MYAHEREAFARRSRLARTRHPAPDGAALAPEEPPGPASAAVVSPGPARLPGQRTGTQRGDGARRGVGAARGPGAPRGAGKRTGTERGRVPLTVAPPAPVAVPRTAFVVLVLVVVAAGVIGILLLNTKVNENAFILYDLTQAQAELDQREQKLEQQIAQASSPAQLAEAARQMGLVQAEELAYLRLPDGEVLHQPVPGVAQPHPSGGDGTGAQDTGAEG